MSTLSYVHQLFSPEQCQACIHALRWKDRPLHDVRLAFTIRRREHLRVAGKIVLMPSST
jgi:hypothetical protein